LYSIPDLSRVRRLILKRGDACATPQQVTAGY
jgi:hypothetical protein